ncbi:hypothetical protein EJB05_35877 [Eragrostis curvula]|uniref:Uncharacterized protein n=1 Tax=Eragrostis curvula TaxID=38414 RepID=A0A5J9U952_9POAL|nr:hypothetical protein EJB05_35877 [Eragrostis curvula]
MSGRRHALAFTNAQQCQSGSIVVHQRRHGDVKRRRPQQPRADRGGVTPSRSRPGSSADHRRCYIFLDKSICASVAHSLPKPNARDLVS